MRDCFVNSYCKRMGNFAICILTGPVQLRQKIRRPPYTAPTHTFTNFMGQKDEIPKKTKLGGNPAYKKFS